MSQDTALFVTDENQKLASDPEASAWVSANAGTGKTAVLVRRVLRLLLAGARPERILCLTYTKNAAAEMENRLLKELADWAIEPEDGLRADIEALTGKTPEPDLIDEARRLFARTLEAKGGLKIYTIHGFCERVLQRFPLEAGIAPNFSVLDGREATLLRAEAFDATIARIAADSDRPARQGFGDGARAKRGIATSGHGRSGAGRARGAWPLAGPRRRLAGSGMQGAQATARRRA